MIIDGNGDDLLGLILTDDILVEFLLDFAGFQQVNLEISFFLLLVAGTGFAQHLIGDTDAVFADGA